ncbi:hypothetical protein EX895_001508 [Sporisorium graminicola]|uniref:Ubiquitin-conjugating enzyme E2 6 n=1 Tax=Sporisorium graminicola TaxID=280036 RepID=A0A4U7KYB9_9BASI|nr:hypothetical protein EX895_001508 [Sporisorium graminicola]TKY89723.1 hypothetical protein EX895_001508 [Sporisorium graminicola]
MASKAAIKRLTKEAQLMDKDPPPLVYARPREDNILEWHYILRGPPDTPYSGGEYHGQLLFPPEFPFKPPGIKMQTPSGRFAPNTKICTSMSDYHPHTWQPGWNTSTILIGLLSFMCSDEMTTGSVTASDADRRKLAAQSHAFNLTQKKFCQIFPEYADAQIKDLPNMGDKKPAASTSADGGAGSAGQAATSKTEKVGSDTLVPSSASGSAASQGLRNRNEASTSNSAATNTTAAPAGTGTDASKRVDDAAAAVRPRNNNNNNGRRDVFGVRSSLVVLAVLAYLFISRVMNATANGII